MSDEVYRGREKRKSLRLTFSSDQLPRIKINGKIYAIIDMSEIGVRFYNPSQNRFPVEPFTAHVTFTDGDQVKVVARVVRYEPLMVALSLIDDISLQRIMTE